MSRNKQSVMEQKEMFIKMYESESYTITALCNRFGISRTTGHKLVNKYLKEGENSFLEGSKAPKTIPHKTSDKVEKAIVGLRHKHTDNGTPFGSMASIRRFSRLCYWLIDVGVMPIFSDPGCPQQNGRHERMHRDLKAYCKTRIKTTLSKQQVIMNNFREEYNEIRPHESLEMQTPSSKHIRSTRAYSERKIKYEYPIDHKILKVTINGSARWGAYHWLYVSTAAKGKYLSTQEIGNGIWNVYYRNVILGYFDEKLFNRKEMYLKLSRIKV